MTILRNTLWVLNSYNSASLNGLQKKWQTFVALQCRGSDRGLARDYGEGAKRGEPSMIRMNYGVQRTHGGGMAVRNISCLPALSWRLASCCWRCFIVFVG